MWLISCNVLPPNHRVTADTAQVFDLAQTLRDGVLLCQLLNNLRAQTINLKEINLRPQMSQVGTWIMLADGGWWRMLLHNLVCGSHRLAAPSPLGHDFKPNP